jgi:hypothetical protein
MKNTFASHMLLIAALVMLVACHSYDGSTPIAREGGASWSIDGSHVIEVASTYYRRGPGRIVTYVVRLEVPEEEAFGLNDERAFTVARPVLDYVYLRRPYERIKVQPLRGSPPPLLHIAVEIVGAKSYYELNVPLLELGSRLRAGAH